MSITISILIPTYQRPKDVQRCLEAIRKQTRRADEVIIVVRDIDIETWTFLTTIPPEFLPIRTVEVTVPGVVAALNAGLDVVTGDIIAITDDDAAPRPDWLARIEQHFLANPFVGGVGGRDWVHTSSQTLTDSCRVVGKVQWFGRVIGNHHLGIGAPRSVDVLKGVNMSYRRDAILSTRFDQRMHGTGAQVHFELALSLALKKAGWLLIYDPAVAVDHYPAQRFDEDQRDSFDRIAQINRVHNETLILLEHLSPIQILLFLIWGILIGTRMHPGVIQCLRFLPHEGFLSVQKLLASLQGRWRGWQTWKQSRASQRLLA